MRQKLWRLVSLLGVLALIVAGCGGDDDGEQLTEEEFFRALEVLGDDYEPASDDLEANFEQAIEAATSEEERVEAFVTFTEDGAVALEVFVDGFAELNAPDELTEFQDQAVSAGRAAVDSLNDLTSALSDVSTEEELETILAEGGTQESFDRFNAICFEAQTLADDAGVDVDYDCEEE